MLTDDLEQIRELSELEELDNKMIQYKQLCNEFNTLRHKFNKLNMPGMASFHWKEIQPMKKQLSLLQLEINKLEIELKDQLL